MEAVHLELTHNPYTVTTTLVQVYEDHRTFISEMHELSPILHDRLIWWVNPHDDWPGFFALLPSAFGSDRFSIRFHGLRQDYDRLIVAYQMQHEELGIGVDFSFIDDGFDADHTPETKLERMRAWRGILEDCGSPAAGDPEIGEAFDSLLNNELEIITSAPVNAGKSTLQNAMIGVRLLPTSSRAKTSVPTRAKLCHDLEGFTLRIRPGRESDSEFPATRKLVDQLNDSLAAEADASTQSMICLEGPLVRCEGDEGGLDQMTIKPVFTDCPGINNANNAAHKAITQQFLKHKNMNLVLFVFNPKTLDHMDTMEALNDTLDSVCEGILSFREKNLLQDHVIFVCNQADKFDDDYDELFLAVKSLLASHGILVPKVHLVCARSAELIRTQRQNLELISRGRREEADLLTRTETAEMNYLIERFSAQPDENSALYRYSTLDETAKTDMAAQVARLRAEKPEEANPGIALIHSGIPGLEHLLEQYLDCCALPMKLRIFRNNVNSRAGLMLQLAHEELDAAEREYAELEKLLLHERRILQDLTKIHDHLNDRSTYVFKQESWTGLITGFSHQLNKVASYTTIPWMRPKMTYSTVFYEYDNLLKRYAVALEDAIISDYKDARELPDTWKEVYSLWRKTLSESYGITDLDEEFPEDVLPICKDHEFSWEFVLKPYADCLEWSYFFELLRKDLTQSALHYYDQHCEVLRKKIIKSLDSLWPFIEKNIQKIARNMKQQSEIIREKELQLDLLDKQIAQKEQMLRKTNAFFDELSALLDLPLPPARQEENHDTNTSETDL